MRILYISAHEVLEYDDLRIFSDAGHEIFSIGAYARPRRQPNLRGDIQNFVYNSDDFDAFKREVKVDKGRHFLTSDFVKRFDLAIINHFVLDVVNNIDVFGDIPVIYRSLGVTSAAHDAPLLAVKDRITVVRYSPREAEIPGVAPTDHVIRFGKYGGDFPEWTGSAGTVLSFYNQLASRPAPWPDRQAYDDITRGSPATLYGVGNESIDASEGVASAGDQLGLLAGCAAYLYIHTVRAPYTLNFMEAFMAGAPIVYPSAEFVEKTGLAMDPQWLRSRYEIPEFLKDGAGWAYSSIDEAKGVLARILEGSVDTRHVSRIARARSLELFDAEKIKSQWRDLIDELT